MAPKAVASSSIQTAQLLSDCKDFNWIVVGQQERYVHLERDQGILHLTLGSGIPYTFYPQIMTAVAKRIKAGSNIVLRFKGRSKDNLFVDTAFEQVDFPHQRLLTSRSMLTPAWHDYAVTMKAVTDMNGAWGNLEFHVPRCSGQLELAEITLQDWGQNQPPTLEKSDNDSNAYAGKRLPAEFWSEAEQRIKLIRKCPLRIAVQKQDGAPVEKAQVTITQQTTAFKFGTAVSADYVLSSRAESNDYKKKLLELFNCVTPENALKWAQVDYDQPDTARRLVDWCLSKKLAVRGHYLFEPLFVDVPELEREFHGDQLRYLIKRHVQDYAKAFSGKVFVWDVVNEAVTNNEIQKDVGKNIVKDVFGWAREADTRVLLGYNDYDILSCEGGSNDNRRQATHKFIAELLEQGAPLNSLGIQGHMKLPLPRGTSIWRLLDQWSEFNLPIEITEYDLATKNDALQAEYLREFMTAIYSHPSVKSFIMWGFWEGAFYDLPHCNALYTQQWSKRPAALVFEELMHKWSTNESLLTNASGQVDTNVFLGRLTVEAQSKGKFCRKEIELLDSKASPYIILTLEN